MVPAIETTRGASSLETAGSFCRRRSEAASTVHHHHWTSGPHGRAECTECLPTMSMGWAGPSPAPSFALISPATITHDVCRRLVGAPGALSRASIRHASDTHDVATDAGRYGHAGGTIGIVLQHVECRPPCDLVHCARRAGRCAMMSEASHSRATVRPCAAEPELERLHTLALALESPSQSVGAAGKPI